jgi:hypothetical protein
MPWWQFFCADLIHSVDESQRLASHLRALTDLGEIDKFVKETRRSYSFKRGRGIVLVRKAGGDDFDGRSNAVGAALVTRKKTGGRWSKSKQKYCRFRTLGSRSCNKKSDLVR